MVSFSKKQKILKKGEIIETLNEGKYDSRRFKRAVETAYLDSSFTLFIKDNNVIFEQGSGRIAVIPLDIVKDIIKVKIDLPIR